MAVYLRIDGLDVDDESIDGDLREVANHAYLHLTSVLDYDDAVDAVVPVLSPSSDPRLLQVLDMDNDLDYLHALALEARETDAFDDSAAARWTIAHWCQELGYLPDLRDYEAGKIVPVGEVPDNLDDARYWETNETVECQSHGRSRSGTRGP